MPVVNSDVGICNLALGHLGSGKTIADIETEKSDEARACKLFLDTCKKIALRDYAWPFANRIEPLQLVAEDPNPDWMFSYRYPVSCVTFKKILSGLRNDTNDSKIVYDIGSDSQGLLIFTDEANAYGKYTNNVTNPQLFPPDYLMAVSLLLAYNIGPRVMAGDPFNMAAKAKARYDEDYAMAKTNASNEEQHEQQPETDSIRARE